MTQLSRINHNATNPALAPRVVVAISSPDPTMEADRMNPGPRNLIFSEIFSGGSRTESFVNMYGSEFSVNIPDFK
jgi:hypothetical protein